MRSTGIRTTSIRHVPRRAALAVAATFLACTVTVFAAPAPPAHAVTVVPCGSRTLTQSLLGLGDASSYFTVPGATFEHGTTGWSLWLANVTSGSEPWKVLKDTNTSSLRIYPGGSATTSTMCVSTAEDALRFFYYAPGNPLSSLRVSVHVVSGLGLNTFDATYAVMSGAKTGWALSPRIPLPDIRDASGQQNVRITFTTDVMFSSWQIDDVQIDPWKAL